MGRTLSPEFEEQIRALIRKDRAEARNLGDVEPDPSRASAPNSYRPWAVILNESLGAGTILNPTSAMATRCEIDADTGTYEQTEDEIKVWNHSSRSHDADTPGAAMPVDADHYWFFGDCQAWADRPAPPGGA